MKKVKQQEGKFDGYYVIDRGRRVTIACHVKDKFHFVYDYDGEYYNCMHFILN